jgi:hypothetical protein
MHYEMVSPVDTTGTPVWSFGQSADGSRILLDSMPGQGWGEAPSFSATNLNGFVAARTSSGWVTRSLNPPASPGIAFAGFIDASEDLTLGLTRTATLEQFHKSQSQFQLTDLAGGVQPTLPLMQDLTQTSQDDWKKGYIMFGLGGSSADLRHAAVSVLYSKRLLDGDSAPREGGFGFRLYDVDGVGTPNATIRRIDVDTSGAEIGPACGARAGSLSAMANNVSADGSRIFFSARPDATSACSEPIKVFARIDGQRTVELSKSECDRVAPVCSSTSTDAAYQAADASGNRVAFVSSDQLVDSDFDAAPDLYVYDFSKPDGEHLERVSVGDSTSPTPGEGANVRGLVALADDGSRVYFVARGVLTTQANPDGHIAGLGSDNLYVYERGANTTRFVASLHSTDLVTASNSLQFSAPSNASGEALVFASAARLVGADTDAVSDVYVYDDHAQSLTKASPGNQERAAAIAPQHDVGMAQPGRLAISADGARVAFTTSEALADDDVNDANDVYLWKDGAAHLVSDGNDPYGIESKYVSISRSGDQVGFATSRRLVPEDVDDVGSTYVAREGEGFPKPTPVATCVGDECQGPASALMKDVAPGSSAFAGAGNLGSTPRRAITGIQPLSARVRSRLARGGAVKVGVRVNGPGRLVVTGSARIGGGSTRVLKSALEVGRAGSVRVPLRLARGVRREVRRRASTRVTLAFRFGQARVQTREMSLKRTSRKQGGRS